MAVYVKFIGALRNIAGVNKKTFDCSNGISLLFLINLIIKEFPALKKNLVFQQNEEFRINSLILINGTEISVLNGLKTKINNGDKIVFVPFIHGG